MAAPRFALLLCLLASVLYGGAAVAAAQNPPRLVERLAAELLVKHLPSPLYEQANNPWPGGAYSLRVFRAGEPVVVSRADSILLRLPVRIVISGQARNDLLRINLDCLSSFAATSEITLTPANETPLRLQSQIDLPIPTATADCGQVQLPVDAYVRAAVQQQIPQWQRRLDDEINQQLAH